MNERGLVSSSSSANTSIAKSSFSSAMHLVKSNPWAALVTVGVVGGVAYLLKQQGFFKNNRVVANKNGVEFNPEHTTNIESKDIHSSKTTDVLSLGNNPQIKTGNVTSGENTQLQAIDSETKTETLQTVIQLRKNN